MDRAKGKKRRHESRAPLAVAALLSILSCTFLPGSVVLSIDSDIDKRGVSQ